jgi:hypothetical protein
MTSKLRHRSPAKPSEGLRAGVDLVMLVLASSSDIGGPLGYLAKGPPPPVCAQANLVNSDVSSINDARAMPTARYENRYCVSPPGNERDFSRSC